MMKKIAVASVAAMVASGAFADNAALDDALSRIEAAYDAFEGDASQTTHAELASLLYHVDNHGAVSDVDFGGMQQNADGEYAVDDLVITTYDYTDAINNDIQDVANSIKADMFGAADRDFDDITIENAGAVDGEGGTWALSGITGVVAAFLNKTDPADQGLVAELNDLQDALDATEFDTAALQQINSDVASLQGEVEDFNDGVAALNLAEAEAWSGGGGTESEGVVTGADYTYAVRDSSEASVTITDADSGTRVVRSEVDSTSSFSVAGHTGTYADYVASALPAN